MHKEGKSPLSLGHNPEINRHMKKQMMKYQTQTKQSNELNVDNLAI